MRRFANSGAYPLPRDVLARVVRGLAAFNPRAVALDMAFLEPGRSTLDADLAQALGAANSVVAAIGQFDSEGVQKGATSEGGLALVPNPSKILWPIPVIRDAARSGLVNVATDASGAPRYVPMLYRSETGVAPSFSLAVAAAALNVEPVFEGAFLKLSKNVVDLDLGYHLPLRFYGPHGSFKQFSAARFLDGDAVAEAFEGKVVLIGATAVGVGDTFATPYDRIVPGVEILATGVANLLNGDGLVRTATIRKIDAAAAMALPCLTVLLMAMRRAFAGLAIAAFVVAAWGGIAFAAFLGGYWLSLAVPLAALAPIALGYGAARVTLDRQVAQRLTADKEALTPFQSPLLLKHILSAPGFLRQPVEQDVAVIFLDLSGFTGAAEKFGPHWARDFLSRFQAIVDGDVAAHDGYVASFMGDGAMILFGLPQARPDDASRALLAALSLRASLDLWLSDPSQPVPGMSARIGAHFGPAVISRLGSAQHQHIAATGDTVNVTSRLLEEGKRLERPLIVSEDLIAAAADCNVAPPGGVAADRLEVEIRGRAKPLRIRMWR